jgi:hypothetical protein
MGECLNVPTCSTRAGPGRSGGGIGQHQLQAVAGDLGLELGRGPSATTRPSFSTAQSRPPEGHQGSP